jgi:rfaE bifunctional protein kinase chain/domain
MLLIVDAQGDFARFQGASLLTPNQPDTEGYLGYKIESKASVEQAGKDMLERTGAQAVLITRGAEGMALFERGKPYAEMPVFNRSDVFDVTGAGDTVVATMALALVSGATYVEATALGNLAAGIVVRKSGTATTSQRELLETLEQLNIPE